MSKRKIRSLLGLGDDIQVILDGMFPFYGKMLLVCGDGTVSKRILSDLFIESLINDELKCALFDFDSYTLYARVNRFSSILPTGAGKYNGIPLPEGLSIYLPKVTTSIDEDIEDCAIKGHKIVIIDYLDIIKADNPSIKKETIASRLKQHAEKHELFIILTVNSRYLMDGLFNQLYQSSDYVASLSSIERFPSSGKLSFDLKFFKPLNHLQEIYKINYSLD